VRILILAGDADGNIGDQAIRTSTCSLLRRHLPGAQITVVSSRPHEVAAELGVESVPAGLRGTGALLAAMRRADLVLIGGGGLFQDDDSLLKMPYWAARALVARASGAKVAGFALGVGPLGHGSSRLAAKAAFMAMRHVSVRDPLARTLVQSLTDQPVHLVPDPAICLEPAGRDEALACLAQAGLPDDGRPLLGVAVRRWFPPRARLIPRKFARRLGQADPQDGPEGQVLVDRLAGLLDRQVERHGVRVLFLPTYCAPSEADDVLAGKVARRMHHGDAALVVPLADARLLKACTGLCRAFLGGRMHPLILAAGMGVPLVGLGYNPKFNGFAELLGAGDRVVNVQALVEGDAAGRLEELLDQAIAGPIPGRAAVDRCVAAVESGLLRLLADVQASVGASEVDQQKPEGLRKVW
jgi:polysaccharide pyruvyl transferase WcaK-like protein